jgi:hypothetical protein
VAVVRVRANMQRLLSSIKPQQLLEVPEEWIRQQFYKLVVHPKFDAVIMAAICLNTFTMMLEHYDQTPA